MAANDLIFVSVEDFLDTYRGSQEAVKEYYTAVGLSGQGHSPIQIAGLMRRDAETMKSWVSKKKKPQMVKGLEAALELNLLPLTPYQQNFEYINWIAAYVFWTGTLPSSPSKDVHMFGIAGCEEDLKGLQLYCEEHLSLGTRIKRHKQVEDETKGYYLTAAKNGALYTRLLIAMGLSRSQEDRRLPDYVKTMMERKPQDKPIRQALENMVRVLFRERLKVDNKRNRVGKKYDSYSLYLHNCQTRQHAKDYVHEVVTLLKTVFPDFPIRDEYIDVEEKKDNAAKPYHPTKPFCPLIQIRRETREYYHDVILRWMGEPRT